MVGINPASKKTKVHNFNVKPSKHYQVERKIKSDGYEACHIYLPNWRFLPIGKESPSRIAHGGS